MTKPAAQVLASTKKWSAFTHQHHLRRQAAWKRNNYIEELQETEADLMQYVMLDTEKTSDITLRVHVLSSIYFGPKVPI